jgi:hypothetical protein
LEIAGGAYELGTELMETEQERLPANSNRGCDRDKRARASAVRKFVRYSSLAVWLCMMSSFSQSQNVSQEIFYNNLEYLLHNYGDDPSKWAECQEKADVQQYIWLNFQKHLDGCIFGNNLLGYGLFHSPEDASLDQTQGKQDAWGRPYDHIIASSPDGNRILDIGRSVANSIGQKSYNPKLENKLYIFLKADLHSQCADVFRNFNGQGFRILAREINIFGAPGSVYSSYMDDLSRAVSSAHAVRARVWVGKNDNVTKLPSNVRLTTSSGMIGLKMQFKIGNRNEVIEKISLEKVGHELKSYERGVRLLERRGIYAVTTERALLVGKSLGGEKWRVAPGGYGWVLIGHEGESESEYIPVLVMEPDESPGEIAKKISNRNEREHPGEKAVILLCGDPNSLQNREIAGALAEEGYASEDILVVWNGNLYGEDGELIAHGADFLPDGVRDALMFAQGVWGHLIREFTGRPVYGILSTRNEGQGEASRFDKDRENDSKKSTAGVRIDIKSPRSERGGSELRKKILESRPKGDSLKWHIQIPGEYGR